MNKLNSLLSLFALAVLIASNRLASPHSPGTALPVPDLHLAIAGSVNAVAVKADGGLVLEPVSA